MTLEADPVMKRTFVTGAISRMRSTISGLDCRAAIVPEGGNRPAVVKVPDSQTLAP
jgi:hypothetical protein